MKILITGARSGLGYCYAKELAKRGHIVYAGVKTEKEYRALEEKCFQEKIILFPLLLNLGQKETFDAIKELNLDILILQAGVGEGGSLLEIEEERFRYNQEINVFANLQLIKIFITSLMINDKRGKVFITSSLAAFLPLPYLGSYTISKVSLYQLAKTLRIEAKYMKLPLTVSVILPGAYQTGFNDVMIDNKDQGQNLFLKKARKMTTYQRVFFHLLEKKDEKSLSKKIRLAVEQKKPPFFITAPLSQSFSITIIRLLTIIFRQ